MKTIKFYDFFKKFTQTRFNEDLKKHTSFGIGGFADVFFEPDSKEELFEVLDFCHDKKIKFFILGNGTNIVFSDKGFSGVVICLKRLNKIKIEGETIVCECGVNLFKLNQFIQKNSLSGLEFSYGIPGTLGGAIIQNAGAYGNEIGNKIEQVTRISKGKVVSDKNFWFSYRNSSFKQNKDIILSAKIKLEKGNSDLILKTQKEIFEKRISSQPYGTKNAGSVFKRNGDIIPAKLIDKLGLKGVKIGGVEVSPVHANFIVNVDNAKEIDLKKLIRKIKKEVKKNFGETLEEEIEFIGG